MINITNAHVFYTTMPISDDIIHEMSSWLVPDQSSYAKKRKIEFLAGRYCAKKALKSLNIDVTSIPIQKDRSPKWPKGITGSISHTKDIVIAAVSKQLKGIGIDAETLISVERYHNISRMIISAEEETLIKENLDLYPTLVFSAKESLYKAVYPLCLQYFGFLEASIMDIQKNTFTLKLHSTHPKVSPYNAQYQGFYILYGRSVISWIIFN